MSSLIEKLNRVVFPEPVTEVAKQLDSLFAFTITLSTLSVVLIVVVMLVLIWKYRRKEGEPEKTSDFIHSTFMEVLWAGIPFVIFMVLFVWSILVYKDMNMVGKNPLEVHVTGYKWAWAFEYKNGKKSSNLYVPVNRPIKLAMTSTDVIHSFFIPAMRIKQDTVPGTYTQLNFVPEKEGVYQVFCTEFCGTGHSQMLTKLYVVSQEEFDTWLEDDPYKGLSMIERGNKLYTAKGCNACHTVNGTALIGPTFQGLFEAERELADGTMVTADANYIRESILNPNAKVVKGFQKGLMPTFQGQFTEDEITSIIEYIKTLN